MINKKLYYLSFFIIFIFAFVGMVFLSIAIHELSHMHDYADINKTYEKTCLFVFPDTVNKYAGYYSFEITNLNSDIEEKLEKIEKITEIKGYSITSLVIIIFFFCLFVLLIKKTEDYINDKYFIKNE